MTSAQRSDCDTTYLQVVQFCAEEITIQQDGPLMVYHMVDAWEIARALRSEQRYPNVSTVATVWATAMCKISYAYRVTPAYLRGYDFALHPDLIPDAMARWASMMGEMTPQETYQLYEEIHPFDDGNGRTGQIFANWVNDSFDDPVRFEFTKKG